MSRQGADVLREAAFKWNRRRDKTYLQIVAQSRINFSELNFHQEKLVELFIPSVHL